jgi:benzoyl-CoA 2,3-dioxygenase component B
MVYLLHKYFGRDGREEAQELLARRSGNPDKPRILGAFNQPIENWLDFFMFTMFTDRDGKYQLIALSESGFDPLARTTKFMLTEEAHHMFVGESAVQRLVQRTCELMAQDPNEDVRKLGGIDLPAIQRYINLWYSVSADLFGGEISSNAANYFAPASKGETAEALPRSSGKVRSLLDDRRGRRQTCRSGNSLRNAMNEVLRDCYIEDCQRGWIAGTR